MTIKKRYKTLVKGQDPVSVIIGSEPIIKGDGIEGQIMSAINWYRNTPARLFPKYIEEYMKTQSYTKEEIARAIRGPKKAHEFFSAAAYGRMVVRGGDLSEIAKQKLTESIQYLLSKNPVKIATDTPKVSVQDHNREKTSKLIFSLELKIDEYGDCLRGRQKKCEIDLVDWFKNNSVKGIQAQSIAEHFSRSAAEIGSAVDETDADMVEGYSWLSRPNLKKYFKVYQDIISYAKEQVEVQKNSRKPRKKKQKTPTQLVAKLIYMKEFVDLSVKSINPEEIIGATRVVVYNTKTATVSVYNSSELSSGFSVKGSKILNFDDKSSSTKKVRDPKKFLPKFLGNIRAINSAYGEIKTKEKPVNGKLNEHCIILQAITK